MKIDIDKIAESKKRLEAEIFGLITLFESANMVKIKAININEPHILCRTHNIPVQEIQIEIKNPFNAF
jgi:hypothetical protein